MRSLGRIVAVARKEVRQLRRDRLTFAMIVGVPVLQLTLFGYAIDQDVRHLRAGVADLAATQRSRSLVADAEASQVIAVVERVGSAQALEDGLRRGRISVGVYIPRDFERRVLRGARPLAQFLVDGSDPLVLNAARGLVPLPVERPQTPAATARAAAGRETFEVRAYYNPERRSEVQIIPGLIGVVLTMTMVLFTAAAIVRERERGNLELLINTPVRPAELMAGKIIPYIVIGLIQVSLILFLGVFLFAVPIRGALSTFYAGALIFIGASLSLGLVISTVAQTQMQAFQMTTFIFLPSILLSGFVFPFDGMPRPAQWIAEVLPLTHFVRISRGILLRDATLVEVRRDIWPLAAFFALTMLLAIARFRKRLG